MSKNRTADEPVEYKFKNGDKVRTQVMRTRRTVVPGVGINIENIDKGMQEGVVVSGARRGGTQLDGSGNKVSKFEYLYDIQLDKGGTLRVTDNGKNIQLIKKAA
jgi:hypothetical protein